MQNNEYQECTKMSTEICLWGSPLCIVTVGCNGTVGYHLKKLGTHWNIRLYWFQLVPISFSLALNFISKILKFYNANQCIPTRQKNKHWREWATSEEYWYALEYKALLISTSTNFLQPVWQAAMEQLYTIRYDTRCYFYVRSKADMSQLNIPVKLLTRSHTDAWY